MSDPIKLSQSRITMLARCGQQYIYRYLEGLREPPDIARAVGTGVDAAVTRNLRAKIGGGPGISIEEVKDTAAEGLAREVERNGLVLTEEEATEGIKTVLGRAKDRAVRIAETHAVQIAPEIQPKAVQFGWAIEVDTQAGPVEFSGFTDYEETDEAIGDTKTTAKSPNADLAHQSHQITAYALRKKVEEGIMAPRASLDVVVDTGKSAPKALRLPTVRRREHLAAYLQRIDAAARVVQSGAFAPTDPSNWWCSARFCGYFRRCPHALRPETVAVPGMVLARPPAPRQHEVTPDPPKDPAPDEVVATARMLGIE